MINPLLEIVKRQKNNEAIGIFSVCSANSLVLEASIEYAKKKDIHILIEATANQVNKDGGYTGMNAVDFRDFVYTIAEKKGFNKNRIILGGDHLGPLVWTNEKDELAMQKAEELITNYVTAGFSKIHIDTSMRLKSDSLFEPLSNEKIINRAMLLAKAAKLAFEKRARLVPDAVQPVYVIGSEVPVPGGAFDDEDMHITTPENLSLSLKEYEDGFVRNGLEDIWENVIAIVVQPGVEFSNQDIHEYSRSDATQLTDMMKNYNRLILEGHSTDYQTKEHLREMVEDGIAILKVGPALTFALREVLYLLELCECELINDYSKRSKFKSDLDLAMITNNQYWKKYYEEDGISVSIYRKYSYSDRCRYYLNTTRVQSAIEILFENLKDLEIPLPILSNYLPSQYQKIRNNMLDNNAKSLVVDYISDVLDDYLYASQQHKLTK